LIFDLVKINIKHMKQLYSLLAGLLLTGMTLHAQNSTTNAEPLPCSTFESAAASINWVPDPTNIVTFINTNPLDGSTCVTLFDGPGGQSYSNSVDYKNLGQRFLGKCLCFDYFLIDDGDDYGFTLPVHPTIYLSDGINWIAFVSSTVVTEGSGWVSVCAPIRHCIGTGLPGNGDGSWTMAPGMTCADFNNLLDNAKTVYFSSEIVDLPNEKMSIDNVCVKDCDRGCGLDFDLKTTVKSDGTVIAEIAMNSMVMNASYTVNWGDGSPVSASFGPHIYSGPGTYNVCVLMTIHSGGLEIPFQCKQCATFCFDEFEGGTKGDKSLNRKETPEMVLSLQDRRFDKESYLIYPNPSQDYVTIEIPLVEKNHVSVKIMDVMGNVLSEKSGDYSAGSQQVKVNTEKLPTGIYTVEIHVGGNISSQKLSVAK
jgi:hypothetical protein